MYPFIGQYIYPPRPSKGALTLGAPHFQKLEQDSAWIAQAKLNGQNTLIYCTQEGVRLYNRHAKPRRFKLSDEQQAFFQDRYDRMKMPLVFNAEALDRKKSYRGQLYVYDMLVMQGAWLVGTSYRQRLQMMKFVLGPLKVGPFELAWQTRVDSIWMARSAWGNWDKMMAQHRHLEIFEGLMVKNTQSKLKPGLSPENNQRWCFRCRKPA